MSIGEEIKKIRKEAGLSQKELGERLKVSQAMIAQYENGKRTPKIETLIKIAEALNCEVSDIDENIIVNSYTIKFEPTPEDIERYKKDAEARELIGKQSSAENSTAEDQQKKSDYIQRTKESFSKLPARMRKTGTRIDKIGENILLANYRELNRDGQSEARKRVAELTEIPRYTNPPETPQE